MQLFNRLRYGFGLDFFLLSTCTTYLFHSEKIDISVWTNSIKNDVVFSPSRDPLPQACSALWTSVNLPFQTFDLQPRL